MVSVHFDVVLPCYSFLSLLLKSKMKAPPSVANMTCQFSGRIWIINTWHNLFSFKFSDSEYSLGPGLNIWKLPLCLSKLDTHRDSEHASNMSNCVSSWVFQAPGMTKTVFKMSSQRVILSKSVQTRILSPSTQKFMVIGPRNDLGQPINSPSSAIHLITTTF